MRSRERSINSLSLKQLNNLLMMPLPITKMNSKERTSELVKTKKYSEFRAKPYRELNEGVEDTLSKLRQLYRNGRLMTFREWSDEISGIFDGLGK